MHEDQRITVTTSTDQSPSDPTGRSDGPENFRPLRNASFIFMLAKPPTLVPVLRQIHAYTE
jgi:hypothetical protein